MRIFSKQHDYYDSVQKHVTDDPNVFVRNELDRDVLPSILSNSIHDSVIDFWKHAPNQHKPFNLETIMIGFCGKVYPALQIYYDPSTKYQYKENETHTFYTIEQYRKFIDEKINDEKYSKHYYEKNKSKYSWNRYDDTDQHISQYLDTWSGTEKFDELFFEFKSPIFVLRQPRNSFKVSYYSHKLDGTLPFNINIPLERYQFHKIFDTYSAYQEIEMYYFGVLGCSEVDTVNISDLDMRNQKGFDKMSFKKYPTKKR